MTLGQLRTFLEVARTGSIRGAAESLVVTEPSVSAAVAALRRELGVELVERQGRGIRLTDAGHELARYAGEILGLADRAGRAVREAAGETGHLRLAAVTTAGEYVLPPILAAFLRAQPELQVSLEVGNQADAVARLLNQQADLAVGGRPPPSGAIEGFTFLDNLLVVVARPDHPLRKRRSFDPKLLSDETWLMREPGSGVRQTADEFISSTGVEPRSILTIGSNGAIKHAVALGLGITLMSMHAVASELETGELARLAARGMPLRRAWHVLWRNGAALPPSAQSFLELLRSPAVRSLDPLHDALSDLAEPG